MLSLPFYTSPTIFWISGFSLWILIAFFAISPIIRPNTRVSEVLYLSLIGTLVILMRLPIVLYNRELNPDESQNISHAITLKQNLVYWQSVDGTTIGPLDQYSLLLPKYLFNLPFDYTSARLIGLLCILTSIFLLYLSLKNFFNTNTARITLLPLIALWAFTEDEGLVHYTSEHIPIALMTTVLWLYSSLYRSKKTSSTILFAIGLLIGMIPFGKLQAVPPTAILFIFSCWKVWENEHHNLKQTFKRLLPLCIATLCFPLFVWLCAFHYEVFDDFITFYIKANAAYGNGNPLLVSIIRIPVFFGKVHEFLFYVLLTSILFISFILSKGFKKTSSYTSSDSPFVFCALFCIASIFAALKPGNEFTHYLLILFIPCTLINAFAVAYWIAQLNIKNTSIFVLSIIGLSFTSSAFALYLDKKENRLLNWYSSNPQAYRKLANSPISNLINQYSKKGDMLTVWGWMCKYYVETGLAEGTAENHTERCIFTHPLQKVYRDRFISDLKRNKPRFFVDAVGKNSVWVNNKETQGYQSWDELKIFIDKHYILLDTLEDSKVFIRKELK